MSVAPAVESFLDVAQEAIEDLERRLGGLVASGDVAWGRVQQLEEQVTRLQAEREVLVQRTAIEATRGDALYEVAVGALAWCRADARATPSQGYQKRVDLLEAAATGWVRR